MGNIAKIQALLDDTARNTCAKYGIPNIAGVIVRDNGSTIMHTVAGVKNIALSATAASNKMTKSDYFNIGSISKPVSGFLMACIIKKGSLSWDTTIEELFPEFKSGAFRNATGINENFLKTKIYELYSHVSGMFGTYFHTGYNEQTNDDEWNGDVDPLRYPHDHITMHDVNNKRKPEWQNHESLKYLRYLYTILCLKKNKFQFKSAQNQGYKNKHSSGYGAAAVVAAAMAERKIGKSWEVIIDEILAGHLGGLLKMKYGDLSNGAKFHKYDAATQKFVLNQEINNSLLPYSSKFPVGGMNATVGGMAQFIRYNLPVLNHATVFDIQQYQAPVTDTTKGGLAIGSGAYGQHLWHTGATGGSLAAMRIYTGQGRGVATMLNSNGGPAGNAESEFLEELEKINKNWETI